MNIKNKKAFTLVELIVTITILAVLGTIWIISFKSYTSWARDSKRTTDVTNIAKQLSIQYSNVGKYFSPSNNKVTLTASWKILWYQWYLDESIANKINISNDIKDPLSNTLYTYSTNEKQDRFQLLSMLENEDSTPKTPFIKWDWIWIILINSWVINPQPIQANYNSNTFTWIDIAKTNETYLSYFGNWEFVSWTWSEIFSTTLNKRTDLSNDKDFYQYDESLMWYWDSALTWTKLKDYSKNWFHWTCYNSWTIVDCWNLTNGPKFIDWSSKVWKYMSFDWIDDYVDLGRMFSGTLSKMTLLAKFNTNEFLTYTWSTPIIWYRDTWSPNQRWFSFRTYTNSSTWQISWQFVNWDNNWDYNWYTNNWYSSLWISSFNSKYSKNWRYMWLTFDNWVSKMYINWVNVSTKTSTGTLIYSPFWNSVNIWKIKLNTAFLNWHIDEVKIYNRALTNDEINILYYNIKD